MSRHLILAVAAGAFLWVPIPSQAGEIALEEYGGYFSGSASAVVIGDIDGDEYGDFVYADESSGNVRMCSRMPTFGTIDWVTGLDSPNTVAIGDIELADMDRDGDLDIVEARTGSSPPTSTATAMSTWR